jgi:lysophospholipase L1-like esterase
VNINIYTSSYPVPYALRIVARCALLWILLCTSGCGDKIPPLQKLTGNAVVVAFGDSITYGTGAKDEESYPAQLESITGLQVINEGIPGEVSARGLERLPDVLDEHQPELLILCHGGNDLLRKRSVKKLADNLLAMINVARSRDIQVALIGVPEPALFLLKSAPLYVELASKENIPIDSTTLPEVEGDTDLKSDRIHPNAAGYRKLAEGVASLLKKAGAI